MRRAATRLRALDGTKRPNHTDAPPAIDPLQSTNPIDQPLPHQANQTTPHQSKPTAHAPTLAASRKMSDTSCSSMTVMPARVKLAHHE